MPVEAKEFKDLLIPEDPSERAVTKVRDLFHALIEANFDAIIQVVWIDDDGKVHMTVDVREKGARR